MEDVSHPMATLLFGRHIVKWPFFPFVGRLGGIIISGDPQTLEVSGSIVGTFSVCCKLKSLHYIFFGEVLLGFMVLMMIVFIMPYSRS